MAVSRTASIPAPVGGINSRDSFADMPPTDAILMENLFPMPTGVAIRAGSANWATGFPGWVESVMAYTGVTSNKLFGVSGGSIYDATAGGAIGAAVVSGLTNSRWQHVNVGTPGGHYLYAVNGVDSPRLFDGTTWTTITGVSTPAITGVDPTKLISVTLHQSRVWFIEKDSLRVWYLPTSSVGGGASSIDFAPLFKLGGYLMAMASWVVDTVGNIVQFAAFITSEGEVAVYSGTDPSNAATWGLSGIFRVGRPVGRRCFLRIGEDVLVISVDGLFPLSKALMTDRSKRDEAVSDKIINLINQDVQNYGANFGWQIMLHPLGNKVILNVPQNENSVQYQWVMNTINNSWTKFTGWNAACWEVQGDNLYYGGNGAIVKADIGTSDNGAAINWDVLPAYNYFGLRGRQKRFTMARPVIQSNGNLNLLMDLNLDFEQRTPSSAPGLSTSAGTPWGSPWGSPWSGVTKVLRNWQSVGGIGFAAALRMKGSTIGVQATWNATDYLYEPGGVL